MDLNSVTFVIVGLVSLTDASCPICGGLDPDLDEQLRAVRDLSVRWLADQQNVDGSWPNINTQNAILGLQLADQTWLASQGPERLLTKQRLEYELMQYLLPWRSINFWRPVTELGIEGRRLGQYMLALQASCISVDDFYGIDLNSLMTRWLRTFPEGEFNNFFQYSFGLLSLCNSETEIPKVALYKLARGFDSSDPCVTQFGRGDPSHDIDTLSMEVMAMVCARDQAVDRNIRKWDSILAARVQCIISNQNEDGWFGSSPNAITTALAIQALTAANATLTSWNCVGAVEFLLTNHNNGDFGGVGSTAQIIPILGCNNFGSLRDVRIHCPSYTSTIRLPTIQSNDNTTTFQVEVVVNDQVETYTVTILTGENLYYGMLRLAALNNDFRFVTSDSAFGQSIDVINGVADDSEKSLYWTIHIGVRGNYAAKGIEGLFPSEGAVYIFILTDFS